MSLDFPHPSRSGLGADVGDKSSLAATRRVEQHEREHEALVAAASILFARYGFRAANLRAISAAAGCRECAIRREFGGKAGLLDAVMRDRHNSHWPDTIESGECKSVRQDILLLVQQEATRIWRGRAFLGTNGRLKSNLQLAQRAFQAGLASGARTLDEHLQRHEQLCPEDRRFLLCAIQAVGYAVSVELPNEIGSWKPSCRLREFAKILADGIARHAATRRSGPRLV